MFCVKIFIVIVAAFLGVPCISGDLSSRLKAYDTLHYNDLEHHHVAKRSLPHLHESYTNQRIISFSVLGRKFKLHLKHQKKLFTKEFKAFIRHSNSSTTEFLVDPNEFYEGYIAGEPRTSMVRAYYEDENLVASIWTRDDKYSVEPSRGHLPQSDHYTMIAYRASDVMMDKKIHPEAHMGDSFCGFVHPDHDDAAYVEKPDTNKETDSKSTHGDRKKREAVTLNTCPLMLVADYHFYEEVGGSNKVTTAKYLIGVLSRVDAIYRATNFGNGYENLGFELKGLTIHDSPTDGYNAQKSSWDTNTLLTEFSKIKWKDYCLAHLFTYLAFSDGVLGLGWVASSQANQAGGICTPVAGNMYYNTAWTSLSNKNNRRLLTQESDLVTGHEFGHNWGSQHDPATSECSPGGSDGNYLMYTYAVSGYDANNNNFSPCSKRSILQVLESKSYKCFEEESISYCGNQVIEGDEECDAGTIGLDGGDPCCDETCQLKSTAVCSDSNSGCCTGCQYTTAEKECSGGTENNITCEAAAKCTGSSADCPAAGNKDDGSICIDDGMCFAGVCLAFCEANGQVSCICSAEADACKVCCKNGTQACDVYGRSSGLAEMDLSDGKTCYKGECQEGTCEKKIRSTDNRIWLVVEDLSIDAILIFMKNNVVMATLVISLIIYVPFCIIVACIDWKREKKDKEEVEWRNKDNDRLLSGNDNKLIRSATRTGASRRQGPSSTATASGVDFARF